MKLHKDAFVEVWGYNGPQAVSIDPEQSNVFKVLGHRYNKDGAPLKSNPEAPRIVLVYSRGCSLHIAQ